MKLTHIACFMLHLLLSGSTLLGSESTYVYEKAQLISAESINTLMFTEGVYDCDKIVILPHKFRKASIESTIEKGRFFVALHNGSLIGYKKLFIFKEKEELCNTLTDEIRCIKGDLIDLHSFIRNENNAYSKQHVLNAETHTLQDTDITIYDGSDFTKNDYRGKGINQTLTNTAFDLILEDTQSLIETTNPERLIFVYGLTHLNDYDEKGAGKSRTPSILSSCALFASKLTGSYPQEILVYRYKAFMPTFDLEAEQCIPKPDSESIPGYGNVLVITLPSRT